MPARQPHLEHGPRLRVRRGSLGWPAIAIGGASVSFATLGAACMHVHLPKPLHGWRSFVGEVGIIVIGVLIALAFEQAVQAARDRRAAAEARANVREEIATDLAFLRSRAETDNCISRRLDQVAALIKASQRGGYRAPAWVGRPRTWPMIESKWHAATNAGRVTLLSSTEQAQYGEI